MLKKIKEYVFIYGKFDSYKGFAIHYTIYNKFKEFLIKCNYIKTIDDIEYLSKYDIIDYYDKFMFDYNIEHVVLDRYKILNSTKYSDLYKKSVLKEISTFDIYNYKSVEWNFEESMEDFDQYKSLERISFGGTDKKEYKYIDGTIWMLKFEDYMGDEFSSYRNNVFSEYISCRIIESLEIDVQETKLGYSNGKLVVGCRDFRQDKNLIEFGTIATEYFGKSNVSELDDLLYILNNANFFKNSNALNSFYTMCVVDAFLGNYDRHIRNWGYLVDSSYNVSASPIYDCGSCLFSKLSEKELKNILDNNKVNEYNNNFPKSAINVGGKKISYFDLFERFPYFKQTLSEIVPRINMNRITQIINSCLILSDIKKEFYKKSLLFRYNKLLSMTK